MSVTLTSSASLWSGVVKTFRFRTQSNLMQTLLRATPDDLPLLLAAAGLTEKPRIDDDADPDIGLSWGLPQTGVEISFDNGRVSTVFLYGPSQRETHFTGPLPLGIEWSTSFDLAMTCLLYTSPSPRDATLSRMPSSA